MDTYDLIVLGSGPAGEKGAAQAAYFGKKVALVEKEPQPGGAAANTGTLPSKTLRETALFLAGFSHRELKGLDFRGLKHQVSVRDFMTREHLLREREHRRIRANLERHGVETIQGTGSFVDAHTIAVAGSDGSTRTLQGKVVLVATGSHPHRPAAYDFADDRVFDSDGILQIRHMPRSMLVLGGGVIGCEYACMFAILGIQVHLVEKRDRILGFLDAELSEALAEQMRRLGVRLHLGEEVENIAFDDPIRVRLASGTGFEVHSVMVSAGRGGNVQGLGLDRIGVAVDERGRIQVDRYFRTTCPNVYAAGDVIGNPALASTSMEQARVAMIHAFELQEHPGNKIEVAPILPYGIYTIPECSMAGETEESLRRAGVPYVVGKASYATNARGQIVGDDDGFLKLLVHRETRRLLGVHVLGEQATEIVHVGLMALLLEEKIDLFIRACFNYPTLTELYKYAAYAALGRIRAEAGGA